MRGHEGLAASNAVEQALAILAYAEVRAILLAWAGVRTWDPVLRVRAVLAELLVGGEPVDLIERAQDRLRAETAALLDPIVRRNGPWPFDRLIGLGQLGSAAGLEAVFHDAGRLAGAQRSDDARLLSLSVSLADFIRRDRTIPGAPTPNEVPPTN